MVKCGEGCSVCCDFCKNFDFNGKRMDGIMVYVGNGFCRLHNRAEDPGNYCDDYYCNMVEVWKVINDVSN